MKKNIEIFKKKTKFENDENINQINEEINNLSKDYFEELELYKKNLSQRKKNEEENMKNEIQKTSTLFDTIKNNHINIINKEIQEISEIINTNINNYKKESKIEEIINDKLQKEKIKLNELKSYINLINIEYNNNKYNIEYLTQIITYICKIINEKSNIIYIESNDDNDLNNKDDLLVNELIHEIQNKLNDFQMNINEKDSKNKIYTLLNNELKKIMDIFDKNNIDNKNEIINDLLYSNNRINSNTIRENKYKENFDFLKSANTYRLNSLNMQLSYRNNNIANNIIDDLNNNYNKYKEYIDKNINRLNQSYSTFLNYNYKSISSRNNYLKNNSNNLFINQNPNINDNNINNINSNNSINININNPKLNLNEYKSPNNIQNINSQNNNINPEDDYPTLPDEILNMFSDELIEIYNKINQFLVEESNKIDNEIEELEKRGKTNQKLEEIQNNDELNQYNMYFSQIYSNEKNIMNKVKKNIEKKLKIYNIIKKNCEDTFNFICNNTYRENVFKHKLNTLLMHINDYYQMNNYNTKSLDDLNNINLPSNKSYTININRNTNLLNNYNYNKINDDEDDNDNIIQLKNYGKYKGRMDRYNNNFE